MPNLSSVLKEEISRIARKVIRSQTATLQKQSAQYRRDVAELKRQVMDLQRRLSFLETQEKKRIEKQPAEQIADGVRYSPKWLAAHRKKLGLSAADYGKLVGVSQLTIYNWEKGETQPRQAQLAKWVAIRGLGKREALKRLEMIGS
ncbi:helix-turn-helix domain-containing protein [Planctomycetales bacterium ZRK34]|nr:helix-turn-helix domain-containing protein [Planctomycetales bacterium ZRK34]